MSMLLSLAAYSMVLLGIYGFDREVMSVNTSLPHLFEIEYVYIFFSTLDSVLLWMIFLGVIFNIGT